MSGSIPWVEWGKGLGKTVGRYKYIFLVILVGAVLLLLPTGGGEEQRQVASETQTPADFDLAAMEQKLADALSEIDGAGRAKVVLTLKGGTRQIVARDESASEQEDSSTTVVVNRGSGVQDAVVLQQVYPQYQGALIICPGGGNAAIKLKVTEAVSAVTGLGAARISVCKGN